MENLIYILSVVFGTFIISLISVMLILFIENMISIYILDRWFDKSVFDKKIQHLSYLGTFFWLLMMFYFFILRYF
jgi:hypothetical protein